MDLGMPLKQIAVCVYRHGFGLPLKQTTVCVHCHGFGYDY